ncbi:MAG: bifunctional enoyl-CoA hydratase/phosphate acetyltransferase, partial [Burkholderiales bacterium]
MTNNPPLSTAPELQPGGLSGLRIGDALHIEGTVRAGDLHPGEIGFDGVVHDAHGRRLWSGPLRIAVQAPGGPRRSLPLFDAEECTAAFLAPLAALPPVRCAVVHPCDLASLSGALQAAHEGLIEAVLVAPRDKLVALAAAGGLDLTGVEIEDVPHSHAAAHRAVELAAQGRVAALMKGSLHTDELMHEVIACAALRSKRRMSHVFRIDAPLHDRPLLLTDAALNIRPTLDEKCDIVANAIELAHALGLAEPRVALLSAVETVTEKLPSTLDAAALCKMAERGQIQGALLDGPLAFDNAVSPEAAERKGLRSRV